MQRGATEITIMTHNFNKPPNITLIPMFAIKYYARISNVRKHIVVTFFHKAQHRKPIGRKEKP